MKPVSCSEIWLTSVCYSPAVIQSGDGLEWSNGGCVHRLTLLCLLRTWWPSSSSIAAIDPFSSTIQRINSTLGRVRVDSSQLRCSVSLLIERWHEIAQRGFHILYDQALGLVGCKIQMQKYERNASQVLNPPRSALQCLLCHELTNRGTSTFSVEVGI